MTCYSLFILCLFFTFSRGSFELGVKEGDCFAVVTKDGVIDRCVEETKTLQADSSIFVRYREILTVVYRRSGEILAADLITPKKYPFAFDSLEATQSQAGNLNHIWPSQDELLETDTFDLHFHDPLERAVGAVCAYVNPTDRIFCTRPETGPHVITVGELKPGPYTVYYHNAGDENPARNAIYTTTFIMKGKRDRSPGVTKSPGNSISDADAAMAPDWYYTDDWATDSDGGRAVHLFVMSVRSNRRYKECEVMLKSLMVSRGAHADATAPLVLHMVVDSPGRTYFASLWHLHTMADRLFKVALVLHPFSEACEAPCDSFLSGLGMGLSFHHSGRAGYCRLFVPRYFQMLTANVTSGESPFPPDLLPSRVMSIETDQLILAPIDHLWQEFNAFGPDTVVAAAENYQPWQDSRPYQFSRDEYVQREQEVLLEAADNSTPKKEVGDEVRETYGIIGGIMLLHLERIAERYAGDTWLTTATHSVNTFRESQPGWTVKLNDQDIFNVLFTYQPHMLKLLDCSWNVQYHARLNTLLACYGELEAQLLEKNTTIRSMTQVPLNCAASRARKMFVCEKTARVLHFMASSYSSGTGEGLGALRYYQNAWDYYAKMEWMVIHR